MSQSRQNNYNWHEKTILVMIKDKTITLGPHELDALHGIFFAIRRIDMSLGEIIYILDQFARRLNPYLNQDVIGKKSATILNRSIVEIAFICASVGAKIAFEDTVWNKDLIENYHDYVNKQNRYQINIHKANLLEKEHLEYLDFVTIFSDKSKMDVRLQTIFKYVDSKDIPIIENELQEFGKHTNQGLKSWSHIQKAIFKNSPIAYCDSNKIRLFNTSHLKSKNARPRSKSVSESQSHAIGWRVILQKTRTV